MKASEEHKKYLRKLKWNAAKVIFFQILILIRL